MTWRTWLGRGKANPAQQLTFFQTGNPFFVRDNEDGTYSLWLNVEGLDVFEIPGLIAHRKEIYGTR